MAELNRSAFAQGVNDAIRALRAVYTGVNSMFTELGAALEQMPAPLLYDLGIQAKASGRKDAEEKILRTWLGRFYTGEPTDGVDDDSDEAEEEDAETPSRGSKRITLLSGIELAFAKVILYSKGSDEGEPRLVYGILRNLRVPGTQEPIIEIRGINLQKVLDPISEGRTGEIGSRATAKAPRRAPRKKGGNRLVFNLDQAPRSRPLFDLGSSNQVQEIAEELKEMWSSRG